MKYIIAENLIAPCGMNCALCSGYQRTKNHCPGCKNIIGDEGLCHPRTCSIFQCDQHVGKKTIYCFECSKFPCQRMRHLDLRYRTKYHMSMIANLQCILQNGMEYFIDEQKTKWTCSNCGETMCVHKHGCMSCTEPITENKY